VLSQSEIFHVSFFFYFKQKETQFIFNDAHENRHCEVASLIFSFFMEKTSAKSAISKRRKRDVTAGGRADRLLSYLFFYRTRCHWLYISPLLLSTMAKQRTEPLGRAHRSIDPLFM